MEVITRKEAKERGLDKYCTGKPCKYGHVDERYVSTRDCVVCKKEYNKKWRGDNKEYGKKWREENKEHKKEYDKKWTEENKEHKNEYQKEYNRNRYATDENFRMLLHCRQMLSRTLKATSSTKTSRTYDLLGYCNEQLKESIESKFLEGMSWNNYGDWHIDHIYPVSRYIREGIENPAIINALDNLIPMWAEHNMEKGDRTLEEYLDDRKDLVELYGRFL